MDTWEPWGPLVQAGVAHSLPVQEVEEKAKQSPS